MANEDDVYIMPNVPGPTEVIRIDPDLCIACNSCANICRTQTILPNPEKGKPPVMVYPDECWFCGCCVEVCPTGALEMRHPIGRRLLFKRKETGEVFRIGQKDPPPKSYFKAPYGTLNDTGNVHDVWAALNDAKRCLAAVFTEDACAKIIELMHEDGAPAWKAAAAARLIGFDEAFLEHVDTDGEVYVVRVTADGKDDGKPADIVISAKDFIDIFHRACVSMNTAVYVWRGLPESDFDGRLPENI